ncbi:PQQ-binding-like beta-propeller repeat protein [Muricauda sp. SCSIO 64092]|uniref:outer membrane protein assembly factor BamB family protein n=1 Tax=Allomuricauda sp. SCSIO 64092 TaxID=2908842 RepID=UPI001FF32CA8|nr:PQQ-binding-like beta-propeller repeat protein [Muricauda sp. SCSIO 64092]UOY07185.1 PQQ-binding-like beta-propeller repeat protein [Muricauda sp. SCSIO 64092]
MRHSYLIFVLFFISCSTDSDPVTVIEQEDPPKPNSIPGSFNVTNVTFEGSTVTIDWEDVIDTDNDQIYYKLYVDNALIGDYTESIASVQLQYNTSYVARVIATDKRGGTVEASLNFDSPKSKILFYSEFNGMLTAFDLHTKQALWKEATSFIETHSIYQDVIYSGINGINGLDILTGEIVFTSTPSIHNNAEYRNIIADKDNVYAFNTSSDLFCVDRITGEKIWERSFMNYYAPLAIDDNRVFVCSRNNDHIYAIDKITGTTDWSRQVDPNSTGAASRINTNPLIVNENIYYGDNIGRFYSVNKNTGEKNWSINAGTFNTFFPSPTIFEDQIITGTYHNLYSFDITTGSQNWDYSPSGSLQTSPFIYDNRIYIGVSGNGSGELVCLDAKSGQLIWKFDLGNETTSSPIVYENVVYIGDWSKKIYAVRADTGILDWETNTDEIIAKSLTLVEGSGDIVVYPSVHGLKN